MKIEKIKPIPKYIQKEIKLYDDQLKTAPFGRTRFYAYFTKNDGELVKVTLAVREYKKQWYCKPVVVHGIHSDRCFGKDIKFTYIAGYTVGWHDRGLSKYPDWYESKDWGWANDNSFDPYAPIVNRDYILQHFPEYKYSAVDRYTGIQVFKYLRLYEKFPQIEYLTKLGLHNIAMSTQILRLCGKDKKFRKWLAKNRQDIVLSNYYVSSIIKAYKTGKHIYEINNFAKRKIKFDHADQMDNVKALVKKEIGKFLDYIEKQNTNFYSYRDYLNACEYLGIDMTEDKNRYPHDFKHWHDIRIDEYNTAKAMKDEQERKEFYDKFAAVASKYLGLEYDKKSVYIAIIAQKPSDLIREGEELHHCVGRMGYDQKFAREESLIFFIRTKEEPDKPLATVEYSLKNHSVLQCYADNDSKPNEDILNFVNNKWLPYANRKIKKLAA